jgi:exodeoxyribonuclease VII large subunit
VLEKMQHVDGAVVQLRQAAQGLLRQGWEQAHSLAHELIGNSPEAQVRHGMTMAPQLRSRLEQVMRFGLSRRTQAVRSCLASLHALSPLGILDRGYSIVETVSSHQVVRDAGQVVVGQEVSARLARGQLRCIVKEALPILPV